MLAEVSATVAERIAAATAPPPPRQETPADRIRNIKTTARALKVSMVLDHTPFIGLTIPEGQGRINVPVAVGARKITVSLAAKSVRKAVRVLSETPEGSAILLLSGRLEADNTLADAGLVAQTKTPKPPSPEAPAEAGA
jgi:hypothetical protein